MAKTVTLRFILDEEVTPEIFVRKVADACSRGGAIRPGEKVTTHDGYIGWKAIEPKEVQADFPFQLHEYIEAV